MVNINKINTYFYLLHPFLWKWLLSLVFSTEYRITPQCVTAIDEYTSILAEKGNAHSSPTFDSPLSSRFYWNSLLSSNIIFYRLFTSCHYNVGFWKRHCDYITALSIVLDRGTWRINDWNILTFIKHIYSMKLCFCYIFLIFMWTIKISIF